MNACNRILQAVSAISAFLLVGCTHRVATGQEGWAVVRYPTAAQVSLSAADKSVEVYTSRASPPLVRVWAPLTMYDGIMVSVSVQPDGTQQVSICTVKHACLREEKRSGQAPEVNIYNPWPLEVLQLTRSAGLMIYIDPNVPPGTQVRVSFPFRKQPALP